MTMLTFPQHGTIFTLPQPPSNHIKAHLTVAAYAGAYTYTYFWSTPFNIQNSQAQLVI